MSGWNVIFVLVAVAILATLTWVFAPKGDTQTVWRSSIILTLALCYIMWAITYLAQPRRSDLRPEYAD